MRSEESAMIVRPATGADAEGIFRVLASAFRLERDTPKWHHMRHLAFESSVRFLVLAEAGEVIGTAMVSPHRLRVGTAAVLKADVGEVAILPERQGQGLGTALMKGCVRFLREQGYPLSRLGGLCRFYARFGYVPFPRRYCEFLLTGIRAGASVLPPDSLVALTPEEERCVRLYYPVKDWRQRHRLYNRFNENRTGSLVVARGAAPSSGEPDPRSLSFVYERDGAVTGCLFAAQYPDEPSPFEARITIGDVAFDPGHPEAFITLMRFILREALRQGIERVTARLPFDPFIQYLLAGASLPFSLREIQSAMASNMMLLVDLCRLLQSIAPELTRRRLDAAPCPPFTVRWSVTDQSAALTVEPAAVVVARNAKADAHLSCDAAAFLRWTLGLNGFSEWQAGVTHTLTPEQASLMAALFPREPCASGPWG